MQRMTEHGNTNVDYNRSRYLRNNASPIEKKLWAALRVAAAARGLKFRRQQAIHPFIADFACMKAKLLIELDGSSHDTCQSYDSRREAFLRQKGFITLRFSNQNVTENVEGIVLTILNHAERLIRNSKDEASPTPPSQPSPQGGGL